MGKDIEARGRSASNFTYGGVTYTAPSAIVSLCESDTNPKELVDLKLIVRVTGYSATKVSSREGVVTATLSGDYAATASVPGEIIAAGARRTIIDEVTVATIARSSAPVSISFTLAIVTNGGGGGSISSTLTVPPYKQMATNSNRRITYTVDGVKYDLLNYM